MIDYTTYTHNLQRRELSTYSKNYNGNYRLNEVTKAISTRLSEINYDACYKLCNNVHSISFAAALGVFAIEDVTELKIDTKQFSGSFHGSLRASETIVGASKLNDSRLYQDFDTVSSELNLSWM